jgi:hypothetical protein
MKRIVIERAKGSFQVSVIDASGRILRTFTYPNRIRARTAAMAWAAAHDNCPIDDHTCVSAAVRR